MNKHVPLLALVLVVGSAVAFGTDAAPDQVAAAPGGAPGAPGGRGPGGGSEEVPDYGDLILLDRWDNGVPIPSPAVDVPDPETGDVVAGGLCWQPVSDVPLEECPECATWDGPTDDRVVLPEEITVVDGWWKVPVDQYTCAVEGAFATYTQEVDFGRINEARSPATVFESQLDDVVVKLATADSTSLDPAGRMVASTCGLDGESTTSTVDSPLQNLAVYRQLMLTGTIGVDLPQGAAVLDTAARGLGAASDKGGAVGVDLVAYLNQVMGLDVAPTILPKLSQTYREEVQGEIQLVEKYFLDYGAYGYGYDRGSNFSGVDGAGGLPLPAYIPADAPAAGTFEYLSLVQGTDPPQFEIVRGPIIGAVFPDEPVFAAGGIGGFAQAADDARAVIDFMHNWPIPQADVYGTPVPCIPAPELTTYDVLISDVSGLQVPKQMVDGSEGREFVVTVANAGPDAASGTVTVTATARNGVPIAGSPWTFDFVDLVAGASKGFTQYFAIDLGERTTIDWEAVAAAEFDVNLANNVVTATTSVKVTGGGGGGGRP